MIEKVKIPFINVELHRLKKDYRDRKGRKEYESRLRTNWEIIRYYLVHMSLQVKSTDVSKEFITLSDIYHSLGASRVALVLSYIFSIAYMIMNAILNHSSVWANNAEGTLLGVVLITIASLLLYIAFTKNRYKSLISAQSFLKHSFLVFFSTKFNNE